MAKLYWRVKKKGKWTWRPAGKLLEYHQDEHDITLIMSNDGYDPEEEEWLTHEPEHYPLGEEEE